MLVSTTRVEKRRRLTGGFTAEAFKYSEGKYKPLRLIFGKVFHSLRCVPLRGAIKDYSIVKPDGLTKLPFISAICLVDPVHLPLVVSALHLTSTSCATNRT